MLYDLKKYFNKIIPISLPIIFQGFIFQLQTLINRAFLGNLKSEYLSVLGNVTFPYFTTISILFGISIGTTIVVSQNIGAKKIKEAKMYSEASISYNLLLSIILFFIWYFFSKSIFSIMGVDDALIDYCVSYIQILSISLIISGADTSIQSILLGIGLTKPILYSGVCKVVLNILLDWILIFEQFAWHLANLFLIRALNNISNVAVSIYILTFGMEVLAFCFYTGISKSTLTLIGHKIGERNIKEAKTIMNVSIAYSIFITIIFSLFFILFPRQILNIFVKSWYYRHLYCIVLR